ncbi:MAG TPA: Co2+/Mg2+ efflux protein ApaG [Caulobacteraceae bacterium]|jgi:ApaG protein|nr:Co2+/Mg2+ efflux protein ApaG [Caulobacteraceae bacterium]
MELTDPTTYEAETRGVNVQVVTSYIAEHSDPPARYVWAYMIRIENRSDQTVQLVSRHWYITDAQGRIEEIQGPGVVGEQPVLKPGAVHNYTSGCPLPTSSGSMHGAYRMEVAGGEPFEAQIPAFSLDLPGARTRLN